MHPHASVLVRFWAKVRVYGPDDCWLWRGAIGSTGYGSFAPTRRHIVSAHRFAYESVYGPPRDSVLHRCDVRACCNPAHLWDGTRAQNSADMVAKGRQTRGSRNPQAKLDEAKVRAIRAAPRTPVRVLAERYGVSQPTISRIRTGATWRHAT